MVRRNGKRKKNDAASRYASDEETQETKQNEVKKFETVVLSLVVPVPELAHANNPGLDYVTSKSTTKASSLLKWLRLNSAWKTFQTYPNPKMLYLRGSMEVVYILE